MTIHVRIITATIKTKNETPARIPGHLDSAFWEWEGFPDDVPLKKNYCNLFLMKIINHNFAMLY